jgi:dienelactone hydrolase
MAELILFHHAQGLTDGVRSFADELRAAGHTVHVADLYEGRTFAALPDGIAHVQEVGFDAILERSSTAASRPPSSAARGRPASRSRST